MKIYKTEKQDGLAEKIRTSCSIAYVTQLEPLDPATTLAKRLIKAVASEEHPADTLYPLKDILVSTGWNLNFDVFDTVEAWLAKYTPLHHPLNLEHNEKQIIGTITSSQAVDEDLTPLPDDLAVDELPKKFHILNGSVIYRVWQDEKQQELIEQTIAEIERGEWFVSMECVFKGFDYAVIRPDGTQGIVARNEESAWMTKHLRQYGGTGKITFANVNGEFKVGRVLRNITFSGKGLVRKPANPESIILNNISSFTPTFANLGYSNTEEEVTSIKPERNNMSEPNAEIKRLEDRVAELVKQNDALASQLKEKDGQAVKAEIDSLKNEISERDNRIQALTTSLDEIKGSVAELTKRAEDAESLKAQVESQLNQLKAEKVEQARLALLTGKGASAEKAAELVKKFSKFTDEEFNDIVETLSAAWKKPENTQGKKPEEVIDEAAKNKEKNAALATSEPSEDEKGKERVAKASKYIGGFLRYNRNVPAVTGQAQD